MVDAHVIVIGTGILGASIAWHLARGGARVTVVGETAGGVATPASFAWINASWGNPKPYFHLRQRSIREWKRLAEELPALPLRWTGSLTFDLPAAELRAYAEEHGAWGYDIRPLAAAEIAAREPNLAAPPAFALQASGEGAVEPRQAATLLIADARRQGATVLHDRRVLGLTRSAGRITGVETAGGSITADCVVLAAGSGSAELAATVGVPIEMTAPAGLLVHSKPHAPLLTGLVLSDGLHLRQTIDGSIIAGGDFGGSDPGANPEAAAATLWARVQAALRGGDALLFDRYTLGYRPTPADGFPIVGRVDGSEGLSLAITHSGVTLAPAIGLFLAREILTAECEPLLAPYRFSRFT